MRDPSWVLRTREEALIALAAIYPERILPLPGFRQILDRRLLLGQGAAGMWLSQ
jgi:hypothetical protein